MKITKIITKGAQFGAPVSTEFEAVVERIRSPKTKEVADRIAAITLHSRLMMEQGSPRYLIKDTEQLPYLLFTATFGRSNLQKPIAFTGLVMLNIPCPQGIVEVTEMRRRVSQIPYTMLAFAGVSGVTLKVVVRCEYKSESLDVEAYTAFLKDAHENAARLYTTLAKCNLLVGEELFYRGCRMGYDAQVYYNPNAQVMPVVREAQHPLQPYEGTKADDNGQVVWYPDYDERERIELEYQVCLSKALDDCGDEAEACLMTLAGYCQKAGLAEEGCVARTLHMRSFKSLGEDLVRKIFRNTYKKPYNGKTLSQMNEKERIMSSIEDFLSRRYELRYNVIKVN